MTDRKMLGAEYRQLMRKLEENGAIAVECQGRSAQWVFQAEEPLQEAHGVIRAEEPRLQRLRQAIGA